MQQMLWYEEIHSDDQKNKGKYIKMIGILEGQDNEKKLPLSNTELI